VQYPHQCDIHLPSRNWACGLEQDFVSKIHQLETVLAAALRGILLLSIKSLKMKPYASHLFVILPPDNPGYITPSAGALCFEPHPPALPLVKMNQKPG